jgi:hypothetical protein
MLLPTLERDKLPNYLGYPVGAKFLTQGLHSEFPDVAVGIRFRLRAVHSKAEAETIRRNGGLYPFMWLLTLPPHVESDEARVELIVFGVTKGCSKLIRRLLSECGLTEMREWIARRLASNSTVPETRLALSFSPP